MPLLPVSLALALAAAHVLGRDVRPVFELRLRGLWLVVLAFALRVVSALLPPDAPPARVLFALAFWLLVAAVTMNLMLPGARLMVLGVLLNAVVVSLNTGTMPAQIAGNADGLHVRIDGTTLWWLGDIVRVPALGTYSVGDVLLAAGTVVLVVRTSTLRGDRERRVA